uniref:C2H2-type domain-containing protein n=1 Tax=Anopheles maculatus TaxID=74869 RepID=A0A182SLC2_9DIPT
MEAGSNSVGVASNVATTPSTGSDGTSDEYMRAAAIKVETPDATESSPSQPEHTADGGRDVNVEEAEEEEEQEETVHNKRRGSSGPPQRRTEEEDEEEQPATGGTEPGKRYICPICDCVSPTQRAFTDHIRLHNAESESAATAVASASFCCKICSKVLSSASSLDRHVLVHTGERPFNCKYCSLTFTTNGNMHRHMRT